MSTPQNYRQFDMQDATEVNVKSSKLRTGRFLGAIIFLACTAIATVVIVLSVILTRSTQPPTPANTTTFDITTVEHATMKTTPDSTMKTMPDSTMKTTPDNTMKTMPDHTMETMPDHTMETTLDNTMEATLDNTMEATQEVTMEATQEVTMETKLEDTTATTTQEFSTAFEQTTTVYIPLVPMCNAATCGNFTPCSPVNSRCFCFSLSTGGGICAEDVYYCPTMSRCNAGSLTCNDPNTVCVIDTCCRDPICYPLASAGEIICPTNRSNSTRIRSMDKVETVTPRRHWRGSATAH